MGIDLTTNNSHQGVSYPKISVQVVIPTLNEEQTIGELIDKISRLDLGSLAVHDEGDKNQLSVVFNSLFNKSVSML